VSWLGSAAAAVGAAALAGGVAGRVLRRVHPGPLPVLECIVGLGALILAASTVTAVLHHAWTGDWAPVDDGAPRLGGALFAAALAGTMAGHAALLGWAVATGVSLATRAPRLADLLLGAVTGFVTVCLSAAYVSVGAHLGAEVGDQGIVSAVLGDGPDDARRVTLFFIALAAPLVEELVFRGYLFSVLDVRVGRGAAILATSLAFAAFHVADPHVVPPVFVLGLLLALLRAHSRSVWPGVAAHAVNNAIALTLASLV
jgi:membrane protease YdiL (CAAX protease family)